MRLLGSLFCTNVRRTLRRIEDKLDYLIQQEEREMADFSKLQADVTSESGIVASVVTLLNGLSSQIADLKNQVSDPAAQAAIDALASQVEANSAALSAAVVANSPTAPATPTP